MGEDAYASEVVLPGSKWQQVLWKMPGVPEMIKSSLEMRLATMAIVIVQGAMERGDWHPFTEDDLLGAVSVFQNNQKDMRARLDALMALDLVVRSVDDQYQVTSTFVQMVAEQAHTEYAEEMLDGYQWVVALGDDGSIGVLASERVLVAAVREAVEERAVKLIAVGSHFRLSTATIRKLDERLRQEAAGPLVALDVVKELAEGNLARRL